jgi:ribosomal protein S18 acetylase RimI-like enzyme
VDLAAAARFGEAARALDPCVEPFASALSELAAGSRARLPAWRVAEGEGGTLYGIAFAAFRDRSTEQLFCAVHPSQRRRGIGRALCDGILSGGSALRARARDEAVAGRAFLGALGFHEAGAELVLHRRAGEARAAAVLGRAPPVRMASRFDQHALLRLSRAAWADAPDGFERGEDEVARFMAAGRALWIAGPAEDPSGYLAAHRLGTALAIEELAVLPDRRQTGVASALLRRALEGIGAALVSVSESNGAARALYASFGFSVSERRVLYQRPKPV